MKFLLTFNTVMYLRWTQIVYQVRYRLHKVKYVEIAAPMDVGTCRLPALPITRYKSWDKATGMMTFLNIADKFKGWNNTAHGALWAYNLNYMDWLNQPDITAKEGALWIDRFIADLSQNCIGLDPYPTALRCINWIKFICLHHDKLDESRITEWNDSLYSQYRLLEQRLEYHLLGNHLLEDAYSLYIGAIYFTDKRMWRKSMKLLRHELTEQILADGAHYEQSPMYHCILLDRLLDVFNFSVGNICFGQEQTDMNVFLQQKAIAMLGHLESITYEDGTYPLFNDAAEGIAPTPNDIKEYARRLGLVWQPKALKECGYRHLQTETFESFMDAGGIAATYQPGHSHADALNYELRICGKPFIIDTGISTYDKTPRRQYERSTAAHNTVTIDGKDSAEVWDGFRVGKRPKMTVVEDEPLSVVARCSGVKKACWHQRKFSMNKTTFSINDTIANCVNGISRIHLSPEIRVKEYSNTLIHTNIAVISIENAIKVEVKGVETSTVYNHLNKTFVVEIYFKDSCRYEIRRNDK